MFLGVKMTLVESLRDLEELEVTRGLPSWSDEGVEEFVDITIGYKGVIDFYKVQSPLLRRSIEIKTQIVELVRPFFKRALDELEENKWRFNQYFRGGEYPAVREDLVDNILREHEREHVPSLECCYYRGFPELESTSHKIKCGIMLGLVTLASLGLFPYMIYRDNKRLQEEARIVLSLDESTQVYQDLRYVDEALEKYV